MTETRKNAPNTPGIECLDCGSTWNWTVTIIRDGVDFRTLCQSCVYTRYF